MTNASIADAKSLRHLQNLTTPIWIFDVEQHRICWGNSAAQDFWGAGSLDELLERDFSSDSHSVRERLKQIVRDGRGGAQVQDTWTLYPRGKPRTVVISFSPLEYTERCRSALMIELIRPVDVASGTEDLRILEAAKASALMVSSFTIQGQLVAQNPAALSCYGTVNDWTNNLRTRITKPAQAENLLSCATDNARFEDEVTVQTQAGPRIHQMFARRGRDPVTGEFVLIVSEEDVTEKVSLRRQLEDLNNRLEAEVAERTRALRASEERYELATRSAEMWDWDIVENTIETSEMFLRTIGYDDEDFLRKFQKEGVFNFLHPDDVQKFRTALIAHIKSPSTLLDIDVRFMSRDLGPRWFNLRGSSVLGPAGRAVRSVGLVTNIQARKDLEESLFAAQRLEAVGQLTGGIAHDFNNLLTVIGGNAELLAVDPAGDPELTTAIREAADRGAQLTRHLLAFSRKQPLQPEPLDLRDRIADMTTTLLRTLGRDIDIQTDIAQSTWNVFADPTQTESAILNLALNARDAMPDGGRLVISCINKSMSAAEASAAQLTGGAGDYVQISVSDSGHGMDVETRSRAFEPFFSTKGVGKGSGLGLSMVLGFSRQSGGDAKIESSKEFGTTVSLFLPRSARAAQAEDTAPAALPMGGGNALVLLLEDDSDVQRTLQNMLHMMEYHVLRAATAQDAYSLLQHSPRPDIYLVDVVLPGGETGVDFADQVRRSDPEARIIFVSGHPKSNLPDHRIAALEASFLQKPFTVKALSDALEDSALPQVPAERTGKGQTAKRR